MKKNDMRIKEKVTMADKINAIERIVSTCFSDGKYTPYYREAGTIIAIIENFIEGIEFEEKENVYAAYLTDEQLHYLVDNVLQGYTDSADIDMDYINNMVDDKLEFTKQMAIHSVPELDVIVDAANMVIETAGAILNSLDVISKLKLTELSSEQLQDSMAFIKKVADSNIPLTKQSMTEIVKDAAAFDFDKASKEIIEEKNKQLREKDEKIKNLEKYRVLHDVRNVLADK